jgi:carbamoyltransferase
MQDYYSAAAKVPKVGRMNTDTYVLGINYRPLSTNDIGHHPAAVLLKNGSIVAMCEEERFVRVKEAPGQFPIHAAQFCLRCAGITVTDLTAIGWNWNPQKAAERRDRQRGSLARGLSEAVQFSLRRTPLAVLAPGLPGSILPEHAVEQLHRQLIYWLGLGPETPVFYFDHHLAHAASAFFASGLEKATVVTWDCWGDHLSGLVAHAAGDRIEPVEEIPFNRFSIGKLNDFVYDFLRTSEKGNLMGLAAYGKPAGMLDGLVDVAAMSMRMDLLSQTAPFADEFRRLAGEPRRPGEPLEERHKNLAADLQAVIEALGMKIVARAVEATGLRDVCFAGGCALNATLNGKIARSGMVDRVFVQPNAGDAGGALGAAYLTHLQLRGALPRQELTRAYWGPSFTTEEIVDQLKLVKIPYEIISDDDVAPLVAEALEAQHIVGWFQLGCEWGPRALGARSILADPRREETRNRVNAAIKYRDWWRPFAPSMLADAAPDYLEQPFLAPFMIVTFPVRGERAKEIQGVVHEDGTTRPQMVTREANPRYYDMIKRFAERTGVPMVMNTSFNLKGEPMVLTPRDALRTFFSSGMDTLVMSNVVVRKPGLR